MTDFAEAAEKQEELARQVALSFRHPKGPKATGFCLNECSDEPLEEGVRWCCIECRDDWSRREGK